MYASYTAPWRLLIARPTAALNTIVTNEEKLRIFIYANDEQNYKLQMIISDEIV